jgi:hypothetical protein
MAATNYTPIQLYYSTTASAAPSAGNLANGELGINITDGKLYYKDNAGVVQVIATKGSGTIGGSTTQIQYNNAGALAGSAAMTFNNSTNVVTLTTLNLTNALGATYGGTAQSSYTQGDILYSSASNTLSKLGIGTVNYILTSSGSVPQWSAPSSISVLTATNLAGGLAGSVPYQSAPDTTTFLSIGAVNRVMTSTGSAPQWVTALTGLTGVSSSSITNTSLTSGRVVVSTTGGAQADDADLTFDGTTLTAGGYSTAGLTSLVKTVKIGDSNFSGVAVFAPATPAKLYLGTGTVTDTTSAIGATNATGAIASLAITPIAATNTSVTYTNAATLYIAGAPSAGTNVTLTNPYALYVAAGASYLGGVLNVDGLATFNASPNAATFQGSAQGNINIQKTGTLAYGIYSDAAGTMRFYNNSATVTTVGLNATGMIVGANIGGEYAAADLNIYNNNANGELLRMEGLGNRNNWNGFSFWTDGVANRHARFTQSGVTTKIEPYETSTGSLAADGTLNLNFNTFSFYTANSVTPLLVGSTAGIGVGTANIQAVSGGKALSLGSYVNLFSLSAGFGGINQNAYNDGVWKFSTANYATIYQTNVADGQHVWYSSSAAGPANSAISFTTLMTLNRDSRLIVGPGTTSGAQALTTPGINLGNNANGQSMTITLADGASSATDARMLFGNGSSTYGALRLVFNSTANVSIDAVTFGNTGTTKNLILNTNGGNVGIGISNPLTVLQVNAAAPTIRIEETSTGGSKRLEMGVTSGGQAFIGASQSAQSLQLQTVGTTAATITSTQQLGLATTSFQTQSPAGSLSFPQGASVQTGSFGRMWNPAQQIGQATAAGLYGMALTYLAYYDSGWKSLGGGVATAVTLDEGRFSVASSNGVGGGGSALTWTTTLSVIGGATLALQGATSNTGTGITFPATLNASSDANTLDDYEEGTWTPTYQTNNSDIAGFGYAVQSARYVKIGKLVTVNFSIATINAAGMTGTGGVVIQGLPFSVNDLSNGVPVPATTIDNRFTNNPFCGFVETATGTQIRMYKSQVMNTAAELTVADFNKTNSGNYNLISGTFSYTTI